MTDIVEGDTTTAKIRSYLCNMSKLLMRLGFFKDEKHKALHSTYEMQLKEMRDCALKKNQIAAAEGSTWSEDGPGCEC